MDSAILKHMILRKSILSVAFAVIWSADNLNLQPVTTELTTNFLASERLVWFQIVNTSPRNSHRSNWLLLGATIAQEQKKMQVFVWHCLVQAASVYSTIFNRLNLLHGKMGYRQVALKLQNASSRMSGLYCLFDSLYSKGTLRIVSKS